MDNKSRIGQVVKTIKKEICGVTGFDALSVVALERNHSGWQGRVEVTELHRVPDTQDLVGVYQVHVDETGELTSWTRVSSHAKGQPIQFEDDLE